MSQHHDPVVIVSAARTPMGAFMSDFADLAAHDLGGAAIKAAVERAGIAPEKVDEVLFGNCLMAGQGQAPARQAGFKGGLPQSTGAVTLSKMCGAGMEATILAHDQLIAGSRQTATLHRRQECFTFHAVHSHPSINHLSMTLCHAIYVN